MMKNQLLTQLNKYKRVPARCKLFCVITFPQALNATFITDSRGAVGAMFLFPLIPLTSSTMPGNVRLVMRPLIFAVHTWTGCRVSDHKTTLAPGSTLPITWRLMTGDNYNTQRARLDQADVNVVRRLEHAVPCSWWSRPDRTRCHSSSPPLPSPPLGPSSSPPLHPGRTWSDLSLCSWCGKSGASAGGKTTKRQIFLVLLLKIKVNPSVFFFFFFLKLPSAVAYKASKVDTWMNHALSI